MSENIDLRPYLIPLAICKIEYTLPEILINVVRYAGVAFHVEDPACIATCGHIIDSIDAGEELYGLDLLTGELKKVYDIRRHARYDFATGVFPRANAKCFELSNSLFGPGYDVQAIGFINNGRCGKDIKVTPRLFKGHIVSMSNEPANADAKSTLEVSFPSHKGFSGTPLICLHTHAVVGMLFSNAESSIETYKYNEIKEDGKEFSEGIYRLVELGLAHPNRDLGEFIDELHALNKPGSD
jgi:hypothetical protein